MPSSVDERTTVVRNVENFVADNVVLQPRPKYESLRSWEPQISYLDCFLFSDLRLS